MHMDEDLILEMARAYLSYVHSMPEATRLTEDNTITQPVVSYHTIYIYIYILIAICCQRG